jgi:hypothetical protein
VLYSHPDFTLTVLSLLGKIPVSEAFPEGLEYITPQPLLQTSGLRWMYQPGSTLYQTLRPNLLSSYKQYREGSRDKIHHPLYIFLAGVGSGKSRHASEFYQSTVKCINDENSELQKRLEDAWVFHVSMENGTSLRQEEVEAPLKAIGTRMLLQLLPDLQLDDLVGRYQAPIPLEVLRLIAKCRGCSLQESTVILVIDGLQNIFDNPHFRETVTAIGDLTAQGPFVIPCCTATSSTEIRDAFGLSSRPRIYLPIEPLEPPLINGALVFNPDPLTKILVEDCGGHGRALELLAEILAEVDIAQCNLKSLMAKIQKRLLKLYQFALNWSPDEARALILAVLTHQLLAVNSPLPNTTKSPEKFVSAGLIRFVENGDSGHFVVPYIWVWVIATHFKLSLDNICRIGDYNYLLSDLDETRHLQISTPQEFERFNAFFRCMKSWALRDGEETMISAVHRGAELKGEVDFTNHHLHLEKAKHHTNTKSESESVIECTKCDIDVRKGGHLILNAANAPYGDAFCGLDSSERRNEVHQHKFYRKRTLSKNSFITERQKAASKNDFFLLITTSSKPTDLILPENSGIVHAGNWKDYFGPFAGRMFLRPDDNTFDINSATLSLLQFVVTPEDAEEIVKKRPFESIDDAVNKTQIPERYLKRLKFETQNL